MKLFSKNILFILLIMMVMAGVYSLFAGQMEVKNEIPISQIVSEINGGNVKSIGVKGDNLEVIFADGKIAQSKKEAETSLTDTLMNYGVSAEQLVKVSIDIKSPSGSSIWLGPLLSLFYFSGWRPGRLKNQTFNLSPSARRKPGSLSRTTKKKK